MMTGQEREELGRLADAVATGELDAAGFDRLQACLGESEEARRLYLECREVDSLLGWMLRDDLDETGNEESPVPNLAALESSPEPVSPEPRWGIARARSAAVAAAAAVLVFGGLIGWQWWDHRAAEAPAPMVAAGEIEALQPGSAWKRDGETVAVETGEIQLAFDKGATARLAQGTHLEVVGGNEARLLDGRATFRVPPAAVGFTVQLPGGARVIDLGTAFEVGVDPVKESVSVKVITGRVRLEPAPLELGAGELARWEGTSGAWMADAATRPATGEESASYARLIAASDPVAHWSFPGEAGAVLTDTLEVRLVAGPRPPEFAQFDPGNTAAFFGRTGTLRRQDLGDGSDLDFENGDALTLEAWVAPVSYQEDRNAYIVGKGRTENVGVSAENQNYSLRLRDLGGEARPSFLFRSRPGPKGEAGDYHRWTTTRGVATDGSWHHIAVTYRFGDPSSVRAWIGGEPVDGSWDMGGVTTRPPVVDNDELWLGSARGGSSSNTFDGAIDEVAIYRHQLDDAAVRERAVRRP